MKQGLKIIGTVFIICVILFGLGCIWAKGFKEDQRLTKEKMKLVLDAYPAFNESVEKFSDKRNILYENKEELYYETLSKTVDVWNKFMDEYADGIKDVEEKAKDLKENCHIQYGDVNTNSKCTTFIANYEAAHNYYISDIKMYNEIVDNYDAWNKENDSKYPSVENGKYPVYKDYIDYDKDGEFFGKEEVSKNE